MGLTLFGVFHAAHGITGEFADYRICDRLVFGLQHAAVSLFRIVGKLIASPEIGISADVIEIPLPFGPLSRRHGGKTE